MLAYDDLDRLLKNAHAQAQAAECHGFLSGQICSSDMLEEELWREFLDIQTEDDALIEECYTEIQILVTNIIEQVQAGDFDFQLLLPLDDTSLPERVAALGGWCYGFLNGFGVGAAEGSVTMSDECKEVLEDMSKISQVSLEDDADESGESDLMELVEYVRVGAILIFEEFHPEIFQESNLETLH